MVNGIHPGIDGHPGGDAAHAVESVSALAAGSSWVTGDPGMKAMTSTATARHSAAMKTNVAVARSQRNHVPRRFRHDGSHGVSKNDMDIEKRYGSTPVSSRGYGAGSGHMV